MSVLLDEGLRMRVLEPVDILRYATPAVLATDLPPSLVASVLEAGMENDTFNPGLVVGTLGPENLAEYVPLPILWNCINEAAETLIEEHPLSQRVPSGESAGGVLEPNAVHPDDVPDIEVLEEV